LDFDPYDFPDDGMFHGQACDQSHLSTDQFFLFSFFEKKKRKEDLLSTDFYRVHFYALEDLSVREEAVSHFSRK